MGPRDCAREPSEARGAFKESRALQPVARTLLRTRRVREPSGESRKTDRPNWGPSAPPARLGSREPSVASFRSSRGLETAPEGWLAPCGRGFARLAEARSKKGTLAPNDVATIRAATSDAASRGGRPAGSRPCGAAGALRAQALALRAFSNGCRRFAAAASRSSRATERGQTRASLD